MLDAYTKIKEMKFQNNLKLALKPLCSAELGGVPGGKKKPKKTKGLNISLCSITSRLEIFLIYSFWACGSSQAGG